MLLDGLNGDVLAHVGGDPADATDAFDRVRSARRQPGSALKPFVLLEGLSDCGRRSSLNLATRVSDSPLTLDLVSGPWSPRNPDGRNREVVDLRGALVASLNVPFVRVGRWCGFLRRHPDCQHGNKQFLQAEAAVVVGEVATGLEH